MRSGAATPEELETLLEDAFVLRDRAGVASLFAEGAVLVADDLAEARGAEQIVRLAAALWDGGRTHVAHPQRVLQARDTALVVAASGISVARREADGGWHLAISLVSSHHTDQGE
jgi:ketosteroid isomerase-like protein